jgi:hypothetical protein
MTIDKGYDKHVPSTSVIRVDSLSAGWGTFISNNKKYNVNFFYDYNL